MITLVVGTNRPGSNTRKVALEVRRLYAELGTELGWVDLAGRLRAQAAGFITFVQKLNPSPA
jgi:hypothetical protein